MQRILFAGRVLLSAALLHSLTACNRAGAERLVETLDEFGMDGLDEAGGVIVRNSRAAMLEEIRKLPRGRWTNAMRIDGYDEPVDLVCALTIGEDGIDVDFRVREGLPPARRIELLGPAVQPRPSLPGQLDGPTDAPVAAAKATSPEPAGKEMPRGKRVWLSPPVPTVSGSSMRFSQLWMMPSPGRSATPPRELMNSGSSAWVLRSTGLG